MCPLAADAHVCAYLTYPRGHSSFDWVVATIDSGAGISVIPTGFLEQFQLRPSAASERGQRMCTVSGEEINNEGVRTVYAVSDTGIKIKLRCVATKVRNILCLRRRLPGTDTI